MSKMDRRTFLKSTMATTAAIAVPTIIPQSAFGANERLSIGLIGCGGRGSWLAQHFSELEESVLVAACDVHKGRLAKGVERINNVNGNKDCKAYSDFRELLGRKEIDAVIIATPDHWHSLVGIAAAKAGKHIYCEKPLCQTMARVRLFGMPLLKPVSNSRPAVMNVRVTKRVTAWNLSAMDISAT